MIDVLIFKNQSKYDGKLQEALAPIVGLERCAEMWEYDPSYHKSITNKTICAGGLDKKDACIVCTKLYTLKYLKKPTAQLQ